MKISIAIAILIFVAYIVTMVIVKPNKIDFKIFKHISFKIENNKKED